VRADQVVARVNGVVITGGQLLAFRSLDPPERSLTPEMYDFLLQRAIDRELTLAAARTQGVELTSAQIADLRKARQVAVDGGETDAAQLDFDENDMRVQMLQGELLAKAGSRPFADEKDVERYYQSRRGEFAQLPSDPAARAGAWRKTEIEIRQILADSTDSRYRERLTEYLAHLRMKAQVDE
jgi:hypothetical protein